MTSMQTANMAGAVMATLLEPFQYEFFRHGLLAATLTGALCGLIGVYVVLRRKNQLGTCRWLEFYHVHEGVLKRITWDVALAIQCEYCREHDAVKVTGSGLDVGFASVDSLSQALFGNGRALKHQWL